MSEPDIEQVYLDLADAHDMIIGCDDCDEIDFHESFEEDGKKVLYLGTADSFARWKRTLLQ